MQPVTRSNPSGQNAARLVEHKYGFFSSKGVAVPLERAGETRRDRLIGDVRAAFMAENGLDRVMFEKKCAGGAGYREWRKFAAEHGLNLPA